MEMSLLMSTLVKTRRLNCSLFMLRQRIEGPSLVSCRRRSPVSVLIGPTRVLLEMNDYQNGHFVIDMLYTSATAAKVAITSISAVTRVSSRVMYTRGRS